MDPELFPEVPEDITALTDEQLDELIVGHEQGIVRVATGEAFADMENAPDRNARRDMLATARDNLIRLRAEKTERETEAETFEAEVATIVAEAGVELSAEGEGDAPAEGDGGDDAPDGEGEGEEPSEGAEPAEGDGDEEGDGEGEGEEPVTAGAGRRIEYRRPPAAPRRNQPIEVGDGGPVLVASAGLERIGEGTPLDREGLAKATIEKVRRFVATPRGLTEKVVIASASWGDQYPEERRLEGDEHALSIANVEKIRATRGPEALAASGGWCAPSTIRYDIGALGTAARPVRDALTSFLTTRGGLQYLPDISIAATDVTDGTSNITEAQDEAGGTPAIKTCVTVDCPAFSDVRADVLATCLEAGNLMQIAFPELVAAWQDLLSVQAARERDANLLDAIVADTQTKRVTAAKVYGALNSVVYAFARLAAGYRSRHRLDDTTVFRALAPAWLADLLVVDLVNRQFPVDVPSRDAVAALIQRYTNVAVSWYLDEASGAGQIIGAQGDGSAVVDFPDVAEVYLYPEGGILFIDQGELNIGLVRDSALNETNDVRFFAEVFENAAVIAAEVFEAELTICPTGETGPTATALAC